MPAPCLPASRLTSESLRDCHPSACIFLSVSWRWPRLWCEWERRVNKYVTVSHAGESQSRASGRCLQGHDLELVKGTGKMFRQLGTRVCTSQPWKELPDFASPQVAEFLGQGSLVPKQVICFQWER